MNKKIAMLALSFLIMTSSLVAAHTVPQAIDVTDHVIYNRLASLDINHVDYDNEFLEVELGNYGHDVLTNVRIRLVGEHFDDDMGSIDILYPGTTLTLRTHLFPEIYQDLVAVKVESDQGDGDAFYINNYPRPDYDNRLDELERRVSNLENILDDIIEKIIDIIHFLEDDGSRPFCEPDWLGTTTTTCR